MRCPATSPLSLLQSLLSPQPLLPVLLFTPPTLPIFFQCPLRGKATEGDGHETSRKQLQTKGLRKQVREAWTRSTVGLHEGEKVLHHYSSTFPRSSISKEGDRYVLAGRAAMLVLLAGQNLSMCCKEPKANSRIISLIIPRVLQDTTIVGSKLKR